MRPDGVTLKEYIERIFEEKEKALNLAFRSQQDALSLATKALDRELEHLNNLRQEYSGDRGRIVGIATAIAFFAGLLGAVLGRKLGF